ncbi:nSTAND1 domain-containing NTPase [Streptomyces albidochromogenes]|uniref:Helix-turn-helix domain-containing protein n=1 Tax=Streptomyces albidochromogenes TaxID=329524 RepID=A0ABW6FQX4_9ACTN
MGRRETPVDPSAGPVQRFAFELRTLRQEAGGLTYREMARTAHYSVTALSQAAAGEQLPSLAVALAYARACGGDPADWERRWHAAAEETAARGREDDDAPSPYPGLARFEPGDHDRFFGRDELAGTLRELVRERRFAAVFGPSGSGKSSLLRAGLIPALRTDGPAPAVIRLLTPGEHPLSTHAGALRPRTTGAGASGADTVVVVDQFEEVFTLCRDPAERAEFIDRLLAARSPDSSLRVVIAVRADFYGRCAEHRPLADALREAGLLVGPMTPAELREAVVGPAQAAGLIVERALTARIVRDVHGEPGGLPLMSHVLRETWRRRRGRVLTLESYEAAGGAHRAIAVTAEEVYANLTPAQAGLARLLLLRLIAPGEGSADTRRPVDRAELGIGAAEDVDLVLDRLVRARLLTLDEKTVDLSHEALITAWPRLRGWIEDDREHLRVQRRLTEAAQVWSETGRDPGALYRGTRLAAAEEHFGPAAPPAALTPLERAFLDASGTARVRDRRRRRSAVAALAVFLVLALVAGTVALQQSRTSDRRHTEAQARRIAAVADGMRFSDPVRAMRLSVAAWRLADTTETRSALLGAMTQKEQDVFTIPGSASDPDPDRVERYLTGDGGGALLAVAADRVRTWDMRTHRPGRSYPGPGASLGENDITVSEDGRTLAVLREDHVLLWDVRAGRPAGTLSGGMPVGAGFSPSGRTLVVDDLGDDDSVTQVWDTGGRGPRMRWTGRTGETVQETQVSADDRWLMVCTDKRPLEIWDIAGRRRLPRPWAQQAGSSCRAGSFALSPDKRKLAFKGRGGGIHLWDLRAGRESARAGDGPVGTERMRFSADGRFLAASGSDEFVMWRLSAPAAPVFRHALVNESIGDFRLDLDAGAVRYLNQYGTVVRSLSLGRTTTGQWNEAADRAELTEDGRTLALLLRSGDRGRFRLVDTGTGRGVTLPGEPCGPGEPAEEPLPPPGDGDEGTGELVAASGTSAASDCRDVMAFSADGRYFAYGLGWKQSATAGPRRHRIVVWDVTAGRRHASVDVTPDRDDMIEVSSIALTGDGGSLLVARTTTRETVEFWDVGDPGPGRRTRTLHGMVGEELALRPDARQLVSWRGTVADLPSGRVRRHALGDGEPNALAFSPDGRLLAVGDTMGRVVIWDAKLRDRIAVLPGTHAGGTREEELDGVSALAFSADSALLAVAGHFGGVRLWDVASGRPLGSALPTPGDMVTALAFGPDGRTLYTAGTHTLLQTYGIGPAGVAAEVCRRAGAGLSRRDWQAYLPGLSYRDTC